MSEIWTDLLGYDTLYEISNLGRVRTRYFKNKGYTNEYRFIEPVDNGNGYLRFNFKLNGRQKTAYLHRLVAEYFVDNPNNYNEVNHKDENKCNNCADNLEWCEHHYNCNYGTRNIRSAEKATKPIKCLDTGEIFTSILHAANHYGIGITALSNHLNGRSKTCVGYKWVYLNE